MIKWPQRGPRLRKPGVGTIFIKNPDKSIGNEARDETVSAFGDILPCSGGCDEKGSKDYAFVHPRSCRQGHVASAGSQLSVHVQAGALAAPMLAAAPRQVQKQMLEGRLFPLTQTRHAHLAGETREGV